MSEDGIQHYEVELPVRKRKLVLRGLLSSLGIIKLVVNIDLLKFEIGEGRVFFFAPIDAGFGNFHPQITALRTQITHQRQSFSTYSGTNIQHAFVRTKVAKFNVMAKKLLSVFLKFLVAPRAVKHQTLRRNEGGLTAEQSNSSDLVLKPPPGAAGCRSER